MSKINKKQKIKIKMWKFTPPPSTPHREEVENGSIPIKRQWGWTSTLDYPQKCGGWELHPLTPMCGRVELSFHSFEGEFLPFNSYDVVMWLRVEPPPLPLCEGKTIVNRFFMCKQRVAVGWISTSCFYFLFLNFRQKLLMWLANNYLNTYVTFSLV